METPDKAGFARSRLPWLVFAGALVLFLITLNRWVSPASLALVSQFTDPIGAPPIYGPLTYLVTLPFGAFPPGIQVLALNILSAVLAALTLAFLARSVALLPHDRTRDERRRESGDFGLLTGFTAWIPAVFAVLICGLQITFWEHATAMTGELLDLLLFAYIIQCVLRYRIDEDQSRLVRAAFVYGIAITNNWAMIGYFPIAVAALVWICGRSLFSSPLLWRILLAGLLGLAGYLILPLVHLLDSHHGIGFLQALRGELVFQKQMLFGLPRVIAFIGALTSVVPLLLISIRWPSTFGDTSALGNILTSWGIRIIYGVFLLAIVWAALGAPFAPRSLMDNMLARQVEIVTGISYLTFYYLGALTAGYLSGHFLLLFGRSEPTSRRSRSRGVFLLRLGYVAVLLVLVATPVVLVQRNLPTMQVNNGQHLRRFTTQLIEGLPNTNTLFFADHPQLLALAQTLLSEKGAGTNVLAINTSLLPYGPYQKALNQRSPELWPWLFPVTNVAGMIRTTYLLDEVSQIISKHPAFYLHPSFGYYFEPFYLSPQALSYRMQAYSPSDVEPPPLTGEQIAANERFWGGQEPQLRELLPGIQRQATDARMVGRWYSCALNYWGVTLQRHSKEYASQARRWLELARQLNPENVTADINLAYLQSPSGGTGIKTLEQRLGAQFRDVGSVLSINGPVDEPRSCLELGRRYLQEKLHRQAAIELSRSIELLPGNLEAHLLLGYTFAAVNLHDQVIETVRTAEQNNRYASLPPEDQIQMIRLKARALKAKNQDPEAERVLLAGLQKHPGSRMLVETLVSIYLATDRGPQALRVVQEQMRRTSDLTGLLLSKAVVCMGLEQTQEAMEALNQILEKEPQHVDALITQGALYIQLKDYTNAVTPLNRVLEREPDNHAARLNRAIALLQSNQLEAAKEDYEQLERALPGVYAIHYGLGEIAFRQQDKEEAIKQYEIYLQLVPKESTESKAVEKRLAELKTK